MSTLGRSFTCTGPIALLIPQFDTYTASQVTLDTSNKKINNLSGWNIHHILSELCCSMKIISGTSSNIFFPKYKLFSNPSAHANIKTCQELFLADRSLILWGKLCNHSKGRSTRQDSCLVNGMSTLGIECNNSMPTFMVGSKLKNQKITKLVSAEIHIFFSLKFSKTWMLQLLVQACLRKRKNNLNKHAFLDSSEMNIDFLSVPMMIRSLANSNCEAVNLSAPSTAALIAAMFTRFARSNRKRKKMSRYESHHHSTNIAAKFYSTFKGKTFIILF